MRFLWVEDFNDDSGDRDELQSAWKKYFNLKDVVIRETMDEALEYLECRDHFKQFDGILLDIRFPIIGDDVYEKYFSKFVTRDLYGEYRENGAGILLYLALVFRYNYSQERIAFVSANVDDERLKPLLVMEDMVIKSQYETLSIGELDRYDRAEDAMARIYLEDTRGVKLGLDDSVPWDDEKYQKILWESLDKQTEKEEFLDRLEQIRREMNQVSRGKSSVKYNHVRQLFYRLGLIIPEAFTKPFEDSLDKSWAFCQWKDSLATPYYKLRRNVIEMCLILINHMKPELISPCRDSMGEMRRVLDHLCRMLPDAGFRGEQYVEGFVKEIAILDEQGKGIDYDEKIDAGQVCRSITKLTRNWVFHQGIEGLTKNADGRVAEDGRTLRMYGDAGFLFLVALRGYFNLAALPEERYMEYRRYEGELLSLLGPETSAPGPADLDGLMESGFQRLLGRNKSAFKNLTTKETHIYTIVSGIGHERSKFRKQVSMDELYQLFWQQLYTLDPAGKRTAPADPDMLGILRHTYWQAWGDNVYSG